MYYKEKIINGILHYKITPDGEWKEIPKEILSKRVQGAETEVLKLIEIIEKIKIILA